MKNILILVLIVGICWNVAAQKGGDLEVSGSGSAASQKYALVIGNKNYTSFKALINPINDATDMKAALESLGFNVDYIADGNLQNMQAAVMNLKNKLQSSYNSYGLLYYSGHGIQREGENYLIPVNADIPDRNMLPYRALPMQFVLDEMKDAKNILNVVILDACRDCPDNLKGGNKGLYPVTHQPPGSIIAYATGANETADDNPRGRNGLYTGYLLQQLRTPGLDVNEVFRRTGASVQEASNNIQNPAIYSSFNRIAYLGISPDDRNQNYVNPPPPPPPPPRETLYDQLLNANGTVTIVVTENSQLPIVNLSNAASITIRGDTAERTITNLYEGDVYHGSQIIVGKGVILTLENITLNGIHIFVNDGGTLVMNNASAITGCNDRAGVYVNGSFTMNGGRIANNNGQGGVVIGYLGSGSFWMKGGRIENNKTDSSGGGVFVENGNFYMSGGTISGNWAKDNGGGVHLYDKVTFYKTGGIIYGSDAGSGNANMADEGHALNRYTHNLLGTFVSRPIDKTIGAGQKVDIRP